MPIHGPLRELGIHDVFQLLDLSRKTGTLRVRSSLRDNEGTIFFQAGRVVYASIRGNPHPLGELLLRLGKIADSDLERAIAMQRTSRGGARIGDILVEIGAISRRELERQMRFQVEEVVFELLSWNEGFFAFEEGDHADLNAEGEVSISTESLLMEGARRIDEWSRIAARIPDLRTVLSLADVDDDRPLQLDLLPDEWEVLSMVDSSRSVREIARDLGRSDFEVARTLYGLVSTGVVMVDPSAQPDGEDADSYDADEARNGIIMDAGDAADVLRRLKLRIVKGEVDGAIQELMRLAQLGEASADAHYELGFALAKAGRISEAAESWSSFLALVPASSDHGRTVRELVAAGDQITKAVKEHYNDG